MSERFNFRIPEIFLGALLTLAVFAAGAAFSVYLPDRTRAPSSLWAWLIEDASGFFTCLLVVVGIFQAALFFWQLSKIQEQGKLLRRQITLAHPPKLLVTNVAISPRGGPLGQPVTFSPGDEIEGTAWVVNAGSDDAIISEWTCVTYWGQEPLPMYRPYHLDYGWRTRDSGPLEVFKKNADGTPTYEKTRKLSNGQFARWELTATVPSNADDEDLFIMGYLIHHDSLEVRHATLFARRYDRKLRRFVAIKDNLDYENFE
jgi:hypothetical protein